MILRLTELKLDKSVHFDLEENVTDFATILATA